MSFLRLSCRIKRPNRRRKNFCNERGKRDPWITSCGKKACTARRSAYELTNLGTEIWKNVWLALLRPSSLLAGTFSRCIPSRDYAGMSPKQTAEVHPPKSRQAAPRGLRRLYPVPLRSNRTPPKARAFKSLRTLRRGACKGWDKSPRL